MDIYDDKKWTKVLGYIAGGIIVFIGIYIWQLGTAPVIYLLLLMLICGISFVPAIWLHDKLFSKINIFENYLFKEGKIWAIFPGVALDYLLFMAFWAIYGLIASALFLALKSLITLF